jgi:hypothetical protein
MGVKSLTLVWAGVDLDQKRRISDFPAFRLTASKHCITRRDDTLGTSEHQFHGARSGISSVKKFGTWLAPEKAKSAPYLTGL